MLVESLSPLQPQAASLPRPLHGKRVLHVLGNIDFSGAEFLRQTVQKLEKWSSEQWILRLDTQGQFERATAVSTLALGRSPVSRGRTLGSLFGMTAFIRTTIDELEPDIVHLHAAGTALPRRVVGAAKDRAVVVLDTPHGFGEAHALRAASAPRATVYIDGLVPEEFFQSAPQLSSASALVATVARAERPDVRDEDFAQLAASLSGESPPLRFRSIGDATSPVRHYLSAADIEHVELGDSTSLSVALGEASIYVETSKSDEYPVHVIHAMALGIPCVVLRRANRSQIVQHCQTGFVCADYAELRYYVALLGRDHVLREHLGAVAREVALSRFSEDRFHLALLELYTGLRAATTAPYDAPRSVSRLLGDSSHT